MRSIEPMLAYRFGNALRFAGGFLLAAIATASAQTSPTGDISGHLISALGAGLSGVTVSLLAVNGRSPLASVTTDAAGQYRFSTVPYGRYVLHAALPKDLDQTIQLHASSVVQDLHASNLSAAFSSESKSASTGSVAPLFSPSGVQGTTAPSGYSGGASDEDAEQLRAQTAFGGLDFLKLSGQTAPACDQRERLLHEVSQHPESFQAQHDLGMLALVHGDGSEAVRSLEAAHSLQPGNAENIVALATAYLRLDRYAEAREMLNPLLASQLPNVSILLLSAEVYNGQGDSSQARSQFLQAAEASTQPDLAYAAGLGLLQLNLAADAQTVFRQSLVRLPGSSSLETGMGMALAGSGEKELAAKTLLRVVQRDLDAVAAYPFLARLTGVNPELDSRIVDRVQKYTVAHPDDSEAHYDSAVVLWRVNRNRPGSKEQIRAELLHTIALAPGRSDAHLLLGVVDAEDGQKIDAVKELETSLALTPGSAQAHYRLALVDRDLGRTSESKQEMKLFLALRSQGETMDGVAPTTPGMAQTHLSGTGTQLCPEEKRHNP